MRGDDGVVEMVWVCEREFPMKMIPEGYYCRGVKFVDNSSYVLR